MSLKETWLFYVLPKLFAANILKYLVLGFMGKSRRDNPHNKENGPAAGEQKPANSGGKLKPGTGGRGSGKQGASPGNKPATTPASAHAPHPAPKTKENISATGLKTPAEHMEVAHHPQLHHKPKPWKEYLLEGLMIFIAVMLGFISENIREDITNHQHVKQLTTQLAKNLKVDIAQLDRIYAKEKQIKESNDSLFSLLQQPLSKTDTKKLQLLIFNSHQMWPFHPSAVAIAAIKNELYQKQFSNSEIISYIATYEKHIDLFRTVQDITLKYQRTYLDPFLVAHFTPANMAAVFSQSPVHDTQMRNLTQDDLTHLAACIVLVRVNTVEQMTDNRMLKGDAINLLHYVTEQYHLDDKN